jgi:hypothetical protein
MKALWKLCLIVVVAAAVFGQQVAGPLVASKDTKLEMSEWILEENSYGLHWRPDTTGYPITLSAKYINSEGEAWRAAIGGQYKVMRPDGSYTYLDINGVLIHHGTWFSIENFQITDHPYQTQTKPETVDIVYYNAPQKDGTVSTFRRYYSSNDSLLNFYANISVQLCNSYYRTKAPIE